MSGYFQAEYGNNLSRLDEVIMFDKRMGYKKLGMAFCIGLVGEVAILEKNLCPNILRYTQLVVKLEALKKRIMKYRK